MEFRLSLLQNEVEHLNKNMGLMSEELVILKEFVCQQFANKFEAFCNARIERRQKVNVSEASSSTSSKVRSDTTATQFCQIKSEPAEPDQDSDEISGMGLGEPSDDGDDDSDFSFEVVPHDETWINRTRNTVKKGKPKASIHKYFEHIPTADGKVRTKCHSCQEYVSNQAQRLKRHFEKCRLNKEKLNSPVVRKITAIVPKQSSGTLEHSAKVGRKLDRVRELFVEQVDEEQGNLKMKCLSCGHLVSNQANRMRKHVEKCDGGNAGSFLAGSRSSESNSSSSKNIHEANHTTLPVFGQSCNQRDMPTASVVVPTSGYLPAATQSSQSQTQFNNAFEMRTDNYANREGDGGAIDILPDHRNESNFTL